MRGVMGLIGLLLTLGIGMFIYRAQFTGSPESSITQGTNNPRAAADLSGVKSDLMTMANAERSYRALNGNYATLEELSSEGHVYVNTQGRFGYTYSIDISGNHFVITASYHGPATGMPKLSVDETMRISQR